MCISRGILPPLSSPIEHNFHLLLFVMNASMGVCLLEVEIETTMTYKAHGYYSKYSITVQILRGRGTLKS